jgi:ATP-dependent DNA helicase RecQ
LAPEKRTRPAEETLQLLAQGKTLAEIARLRERQLGTVVGTVATLVESGEVEFDAKWVEPTRTIQIEMACARLGAQWLKPLKEALPADIPMEEIRLVVAKMRRKQLLEKRSARA